MAYFLGERRLLITGLLFSIIEQAMLALVTSKWQALAAVSLGSLAGVSFPAISSIKSTHSRPDQQGLVQGALAGIRALATGLGPLAFAQLFSSCTKTSAGEGLYIPCTRSGVLFVVRVLVKVVVYCLRIAVQSWASATESFACCIHVAWQLGMALRTHHSEKQLRPALATAAAASS
jgi:MFS family permease